jgi:hypothetical protein
MNLAADAVILIHIAYFVFVVGGFAGIVLGPHAGAKWIYNPWIRLAHVTAVWIVLLEDIFDVPCVLSVMEANLKAQSAALNGSLDLLLHHTISPQALDWIYWTLGPTSIVLLFVVKPRWNLLRRA